MMRIDPNSWYYSPDHGQLCRVIETQTLWGETICRAWLPGKDTVVRLPAARLWPVSEVSIGTVDEIAYLAAVAQLGDTLKQDVPLEPQVLPETMPLLLVRVEGGAHG